MSGEVISGSFGVVVWGISPQALDSHEAFARGASLTFPLLSDPELTVHQAYGAYGEKNNYGRIVTGTIRSTFVVDEQGAVELPLYNVKATGHVASLRKKLGLD